MAIADNMRTDLQTKYMKCTAENMKYAKYSTDILIANGYFEQILQAINHENLT